jgi:K+-sensing histidine kinase KdpD
MRSISSGRKIGPWLPRSLLVGGVIVAGLTLSLILSEVVHTQLPVYAHVHLYGAIFLATRVGGLVSGIASFIFILVFSDFFLTQPVHVLFPIYDMPDYVTFSFAAAGSIWIGFLGRKMAAGRSQR